MAELIVDSYLKAKFRCHRRKYVLPARKLVASLWRHPSIFFRFSTSAEHYGAKRKQVWMSRVVLTLFRHMRDMDPPMFNLVEAAIPPAMAFDGQGRSAVYCKSQFFTTTLKGLTELDIVPDPELPRISLKNEDDVWLPIPVEEQEALWYKETDRILGAHSQMLYKANIRLSDGSPMPPGDWYYYRRFKGSLRLTGRLYSAFQNYPKIERLGVTFDGVPAASIDFTALHPLLLLRIFHQLDREPPGLLLRVADPYDMPWYSHLPRTVHKRLINALFNAKSKESAIRAFLSTYYWYDAIKDEVAVEVYSGPKKRRGIKAFEGNRQEIERYILIFCLHHPMFREQLFKGAGSALQYLDSEVILTFLDLCLTKRIPVLPVHDEVVFPKIHISGVRQSLILACQQVLRVAGRFGNLPIKTRVIKNNEILEEAGFLNLNIC